MGVEAARLRGAHQEREESSAARRALINTSRAVWCSVYYIYIYSAAALVV